MAGGHLQATHTSPDQAYRGVEAESGDFGHEHAPCREASVSARHCQNKMGCGAASTFKHRHNDEALANHSHGSFAALPAPPSLPVAETLWLVSEVPALDANFVDLDLDDKGQNENAPEGDEHYVGEWQGSLRHGQGTLTRKGGSSYVGTFHEGKAHGEGVFTQPSGSCFQGQWESGRAHGYGKYTHEDGGYYHGEWREDRKCGQGTERWVDGAEYTGEFWDGLKHGAGTFFLQKGRKCYIGQFVMDKMHGDGTYHFNDGRCFAGQWMDGQMNGQGTMDWPDGSKYVGCYQNGVRHGHGEFTWPNGKSYAGEWAAGKFHGRGILTQTDVRKVLRGEWSDGKPQQVQEQAMETDENATRGELNAAATDGSTRKASFEGA